MSAAVCCSPAPPGCGKTEIPRLIAHEAGVAVLAASLSRWEASGARSSDVIREMRTLLLRWLIDTDLHDLLVH